MLILARRSFAASIWQNCIYWRKPKDFFFVMKLERILLYFGNLWQLFVLFVYLKAAFQGQHSELANKTSRKGKSKRLKQKSERERQ